MIRFLIKRKWGDNVVGGNGSCFYTIDGDITELEECLRKGGTGEYGYEIHELIGCEVVD